MITSFKVTTDYLALHRWFSASKQINDLPLTSLLDDCRQQLGITKDIPLHLCAGQDSPCIAGLINPVIYLPETSRFWSEETLRMVLLHELGHLARRDFWTSLAARLSCLVH